MSDQTAKTTGYFTIETGSGDLIETFDSGFTKRWKSMPDGTYAPVVYSEGSSGGGSAASAVDREPIITKYKVTTAFTGASVGDKIVHTRWVDVDGATPALWAEEWYNDTTRTALASAPLAANLGEAGGGGTADSTATNQLTQITRETEIRDAILARVDKHGSYKFVQSEEFSGTTYILKSDGTGWLMTKIVSTATTDAATYAGVGNNSTITLATAWANKATLVYGSIAAV